MSKNFKNYLTFVICWLFFTGALYSGTTGKIAGRVIDENTKEPMAGVNILIEDTFLGAASDLDGDYFIINIPPGVYTVQASMIGFETVRITNVRVSLDLTTKINFSLQSEVLTGEEIVVIAEKPLLQRDATAHMASIDGSTIAEKLPVTDINDVLAMQAGFSKDQQGKLHLRGGRFGEITYMVDGVYVSDPFVDPFSTKFGGTATSPDAIAELQVLSGTFNAEYGNSMSGVVNMVTKEGGKEYHGKIQYESPMLNSSPYHKADWLLDTDDVKNLSAEEQLKYRDARRDDSDNSLYEFESVIDDKTFEDIIILPVLGDFSGSIDGPFPFIPKLTFLISGRLKNEDSYLPWGFDLLRDIMGKMTYKLNPMMKLSATIERSQNYHQDYSHYYKYYKYYEKDNKGNYGLVKEWHNRELLSWSHTLSNSTFYTLRLSRFHSHFEFKDTDKTVWYNSVTGELDSSDYIESTGAGGFVQGGTDYWWENETETLDGKFDLTSQIHTNHQIKTGLEVKRHEIFRHYIEKPTKKGAVNNLEFYRKYPWEIAFYVQDKIEYDYLIINLGLRLDYSDPKSNGWDDMGDIGYLDSSGTYQASAGEEGKPKYQLSPRIGLAHPFSDRTMLHFSYGHFFQNPAYSSMFVNRDVTAAKPLLGDIMMKPQKTVAFEIGLKHSFTDLWITDISLFLKDINDLVGSTYFARYPYDYTVYNNSDFARVEGITIIIERRYQNYFTAGLNYTLSIAQGNESDPSEGFTDYSKSNYNLRPNRDFYLDFDRRHVFTINADLRFPQKFGPRLLGFKPLEKFGINVLVDASSGLPYTPMLPEGQTRVEKNSERMPWTANVNLRANRNFNFAGIHASIFIKVNNLFDRLNTARVWQKTGKAWDEGPTSSYSLDRQADPTYIGMRRSVKLGVYLKF
jgi:outer membrane receptor for ferrienterochelin and colicin